MDVDAWRRFWATMDDLTDGGRTIVFATHYLDEADAFADRIVVLNDGRIVADGTGAQIKAVVGGRHIRFAGPDRDWAVLPGVVSSGREADGWVLNSADSDATLRALLADPDVHDVLPALLAAAPGVRVIVLTTFGRPGYLRRAMEAGAVGFLVKDTPVDRLLDGLRRVASGLRVVDPELAVASLSIGASPLSEREALVLAASAGGASTGEIATAAHLSEGTVRNYLSSAIGKLGARNRAEALRTAGQRLGVAMGTIYHRSR